MLRLAALIVALAPAVAGAAGVEALKALLEQTTTARARFAQMVLDRDLKPLQQATGTMQFSRPGKFRWELTPDAGVGATQSPQLMIADGKNLWFYDRDLEQVSVKAAATALTATPASLLSGDGKLGEYFTVSADGRRDGFEWVKVVPTRSDADFREAQLAFRNGGSELGRMVLKDKLGQTVRLDFNSSARNVPVAEAEVQFTPPAGTDLIGTPVP